MDFNIIKTYKQSKYNGAILIVDITFMYGDCQLYQNEQIKIPLNEIYSLEFREFLITIYVMFYARPKSMYNLEGYHYVNGACNFFENIHGDNTDDFCFTCGAFLKPIEFQCTWPRSPSYDTSYKLNNVKFTIKYPNSTFHEIEIIPSNSMIKEIINAVSNDSDSYIDTTFILQNIDKELLIPFLQK